LKYYPNRYDSSIKWIEENNHAVISNGPFYLKSYSPESRTITVNSFDDDSYPFKIGEWAKFENTEFPIIKKIDLEKVVQRGDDFKIGIETENTDDILYFLTNSEGEEVSSETIKIENNAATINLSLEKTQNLGIGANNIKIFAISDSVLKPDFYESSFIVTEEKTELPTSLIENIEFSENNSDYSIFIIPIIVIIGIVIYLKKRQS